jgi:hypothetical protein
MSALVDVGAIDARGIDLGNVSIKGDLGQIDVGNDLDPRPGLGSLSANSLGHCGTQTQLPDGSFQTEITGALKSLRLASDMQDAELSVSGNIGTIAINGGVLGSAIRSDGKIGPIRIIGDLALAEISARGNLLPKTSAAALAIASLSVGGSVNHAQILVGYDLSAAAVNGDVRIGTLTVGRDWIASNLVVGAHAGDDGFFGTEDDATISQASSVIAKIAWIRIKGSAAGTFGGTDHFGFVAEEIGSFQIGLAKLILTAGANNDLTGFTIGTTGDVIAREVRSGAV